MRVTLRSLRIGWSAIVDVPDKCLVGELRAEAAKAAGIQPAGRAKLVLRGAPLQVSKWVPSPAAVVPTTELTLPTHHLDIPRMMPRSHR